MKKTRKITLSSALLFPIIIFFAIRLTGCADPVYILALTTSQPVFEAAKKGDLGRVKAEVLLFHDADGGTDYFGNTLLEDAVSGGNPKIVEFLLDHGADVNRRGMGQATALHCAAGGRHLEAAKLLLDHKANVNAKNDAGSTPLILACSVGAVGDVVPYEMVKLLIAFGADVNAEDLSGTTALHAAAASDRTEIVTLLLAHQANVNAKSNKDALCWTPLHSSAANGATDVILPLLANGADIDAKDVSGMTPLDIAAYQSKKEYRLFENSYDVEEAEERRSIAKLLRSNGARYTIYDAAAMDDLNKMQVLLSENPALISIKDGDGKAPIHYAASLDSTSVVKFLLAAHADVNSRDAKGETPLECAVAAGRQNVALLLLADGADVNAADNEGWTPLHVASGTYSNDIQFVELLLAHGADINAKAKDGRTPLATSTQYSVTSKLLIAHGGHN